MNRVFFIILYFVVIGSSLGSEMRLGFAPRPSDIFWEELWHLENRNFTNGARLGVDINVRKAWSATSGEGIIIGVADTGVDLDHPELKLREAADLHFNFGTGEPSGWLFNSRAHHGTPVTGLIIAPAGDGRGMVGVAPNARFASWVIWETNSTGNERFVSGEKMAAMFNHAVDRVAVQNHSWAKSGPALVQMSIHEHAAISNAVTHGRGGRGVVLVHASGNERLINGRNANDDNYKSDPRVITVGAARDNGAFASYSNPGANILVGAPSGESGFKTLVSTDRVGAAGYNFPTYADPELNNYVFYGTGFTGTSGAAPLVSGTVALMLAANPNLTYRDVQQLLIHSSRHFDLADTDITTNGAGFVVGHNLGFGLIDAGRAVEMARKWITQPEPIVVTKQVEQTKAIPDAGARVVVKNNLGVEVASLPGMPAFGSYPDEPTGYYPISYVGAASEPLTTNLTGRAALIRGDSGSFFSVKFKHAADAGAALAIIYNDRPQQTNEAGQVTGIGPDGVSLIGSTDYLGIPMIFISKNSGEALRTHLDENPNLAAEIRLFSAEYSIPATETLVAQHIGLRLKTDHQRRGDLRVTLVSPAGTRSVMQSYNGDDMPGPVDWTYYSTHHFYESTAGTWKVYVTDLFGGNTGSVTLAGLELRGHPILDLDADGLDDAWELLHFTSLSQTAALDPDGDGYSNAREQTLGRNPAADETVYAVRADLWAENFVRLSWPSIPGRTYEISTHSDLRAPFNIVTNVPAGWLENALVLPVGPAGRAFYNVDVK